MNHPYIAKVYDANEHQGFVYMVMEKIEGHTLGQYLKTKIVDAKSALKLFCQICEAVEHAHQHQVIHADIKPENIMVDEQGNPKLLDFNITQKQQVLTNQAASVKAFSKEFASPEQKKGEHLTQQSDVFSLGKLIKVLLNEKTICHELELVIDKATQKNAESRYNSVNALRIDIENYLKSRPISILAHSSWYVIQKLVRRRPIVTTSSLGAFLVSIAFSVALVEQNNQLINEQALTEEMVLELTNIIFHSKSARNLSEMSNMLELTKRQVMANQELPIELKKKMLVMMLAPVPKKQEITSNCEPKCIESQNDE